MVRIRLPPAESRANFISSACTTLLRSAGELASPHIRACGRSPTPLLSGGGADRGPQHLARTVFVAGWSKYSSTWVSRAYGHPDCPRAPLTRHSCSGRRLAGVEEIGVRLHLEDPACRIRDIAMPRRHPCGVDDRPFLVSRLHNIGSSAFASGRPMRRTAARRCRPGRMRTSVRVCATAKDPEAGRARGRGARREAYSRAQ